MTTGGWIIMILSVTGVSALFFWSLHLALTREQDPEHLHSTLDEPPDIEEDE